MKNTIFTNPVIEQDMKKILGDLGEQIFKFENKNILITGASGMLGHYMVLAVLYANKYKLKKPAQLYLVTRSKNDLFVKDKNVHYINSDISRPLPLLKDIHYIIHAASKAAPKNYMKSRVDTLNSNILGLYNLLALSSNKLESFLYFSSGEIYGSPKLNKPINEEYIGVVDHLNARSCYTEGKRAGETICMNYFWEKELPVKIARIFHTFGPGLNITDGRIFSDVIKNGLDKKNIEIKGDPNVKRPFLYLQDATSMFFLLLLSNKNGSVYNISNDKNVVSVGTFAKIVCSEFNKYYKKKLVVKIEKHKRNTFYKHAVKAIRPDISKFKKDFGYTPHTTVAQAVEKTVGYYMQKNK